MSNVNAPNGFVPVGTIGQNGYCGKVERFYTPSTTEGAIGIGDPVCLLTSLHTDGTPQAVRATSTAKVVGVCVGIELVPTDLTLTYRKPSTSQSILVDTAPDTIYEVQEDSVGGYIALADGQKNINFVLGTVDTTTGNGLTMLDSSSVTTSSGTALDCLLLRPSVKVDNTPGANYCRWLVKFNLHQYGLGAVLAGV